MDFLAVLDYEHLDNGVFLNSFAKSLSKKKKRGLIIHGDSEYTERIIQTGVMRENARIRAIKELNHRLVALFADEGVSTIALNGFQKSLITIDNGEIEIMKNQIDDLSDQPMILLSNLVHDLQTNDYRPIPLSDLADALAEAFDIENITVFSIDETSDVIKQDFPETLRVQETDEDFVKKHIPENLRNLSINIRLKSASTF